MGARSARRLHQQSRTNDVTPRLYFCLTVVRNNSRCVDFVRTLHARADSGMMNACHSWRANSRSGLGV